jgi:hypothetical protein
MRRVMVRYRVRPDQAAANEELVLAVWDGHNPLTDVEAFTVFQEGIRDRCDEAPVATVLREIGSYRLFGDRAG